MEIVPIIFSQVYCIHDNRLLLIHRAKEPNLGLWVAPGGKIQAEESPFECAAREFHEETGLKASNLFFRGIISLVLPNTNSPSLEFIYLSTEFSGSIGSSTSEGYPEWHSIRELETVPMPKELPIVLRQILDKKIIFFQAKFIYNSRLEFIDHLSFPSDRFM